MRNRPREPVPPIALRLEALYRSMFTALGPQGWWPGRTRFEVIVGAILTQNTAWTNVTLALANLRRARALTPAGLASLPQDTLAALIRPAGYHNIKASRLRHFLRYLGTRYRLRLDRMFAQQPSRLRRELLAVSGIGPETADSILLYAGKVPIFVVDAYTRRILSRHALIAPDADYDGIQALLMGSLHSDASRYNEYHALLVAIAKKYCRPTPRCARCPLRNDLARFQPGAARRYLRVADEPTAP
jgi:endonuclease-3 related protein